MTARKKQPDCGIKRGERWARCLACRRFCNLIEQVWVCKGCGRTWLPDDAPRFTLDFPKMSSQVKDATRRKKNNELLRAAGIPAYFPTVGLRRRYEALACLGWRQLDVNMQAFGADRSMNWMRRPTVLRATALAVMRAYEALWDKPGPSRNTATMARTNGWSPPMAWDDGQIDDPEAFSSTQMDAMHTEALRMNRVRDTLIRRQGSLQRKAIAAQNYQRRKAKKEAAA